jgi:hypothetical protein
MSATRSSHKRGGVDALLTSRGKDLGPGESASFRLVKGPGGTVSADPVDPGAPRQAFPLIAKFSESVVRPDFTRKPWSDGRLYQQDVPKAADDSEDEDNNTNGNAAKPKKRWRGMASGRPEAAPRQWILQEQVDFLETMVARRENKKRNNGAASGSGSTSGKLSTRYVGTPESNPSAFAVLVRSGAEIQVVVLPPSSTVSFSQPAARKTLSLAEAEQAIEDQRMGIRSMRHLQDDPDPGSAAAAAAAAGSGPSATAPSPTLRPPVRRLLPNKNTSKARLMDKLKKRSEADDVEEADDVMGDVTFTNRKGGSGGGHGAGGGGASSSGARRELLESLGDGVTVSDEGVLGGANDALFGGRQRFASFQAGGRRREAPAGGDEPGGAGAGASEERGADGAAMADDFYQRDVQAEYEELDYDANEQFDDDDVDVGETEVAGDGGDDGYEQDDDEDDDDDLDREGAVSGAEGLASVAGFKMMLAKARGEVAPDRAAAAPSPDGSAAAGAAPGQEEEGDHMAKIMAAAEKTAQAAKERTGAPAPAKPAASAAAAIQVDENGLRIISLESVRKEIWLNQGQIPVKRLMKIFDVKKKSSAERQDRFREVIKELCAMKTDAVGGKILVLKQHYANMG